MLFIIPADLRRPRSESSGFYSSESQGDAPLTKKHKPNPEIHQARPSKPGSTPLGLAEQVHKSKTCPAKAARAGAVDKESGKGDKPQTKLGGGRWTRQTAGRRGPIGGLAKERLANRLRLRESAGTGSVSELLVGQEDLENTGDLQVWRCTSLIKTSLWFIYLAA